MTEIPRAQHYHDRDIIEAMAFGNSWWLTKICETEDIDPLSITSIVELGSGEGPVVKALLEIFPNAIVHAVDYHDVLLPEIRSNPRVKFRQGLLVNVLPTLSEEPNLVILKYIARRHGFNFYNIRTLKDLLGPNGLLITQGDNAGLESEYWFRDHFNRYSTPFIQTEGPIDPTILWKAK